MACQKTCIDAMKHRCYTWRFRGRISPAKRVDRVIEIAKARGMAIKIATKADAATGPTARTSWLLG
jgi:hypothetical protein